MNAHLKMNIHHTMDILNKHSRHALDKIEKWNVLGDKLLIFASLAFGFNLFTNLNTQFEVSYPKMSFDCRWNFDWHKLANIFQLTFFKCNEAVR